MEKKINIKVYALSTCIWCKKTLEYLKKKNIEFEHVYVDLLDEPERSKVTAEVEKYNPQGNFPTVVINGVTLSGFDTDGFDREISKCR